MESKYYTSWEQYVAEHPEIQEQYEPCIATRIHDYEDMMFTFIMNLFV